MEIHYLIVSCNGFLICFTNCEYSYFGTLSTLFSFCGDLQLYFTESSPLSKTEEVWACLTPTHFVCESPKSEAYILVNEFALQIKILSVTHYYFSFYKLINVYIWRIFPSIAVLLIIIVMLYLFIYREQFWIWNRYKHTKEDIWCTRRNSNNGNRFWNFGRLWYWLFNYILPETIRTVMTTTLFFVCHLP